MAKWMRRLLWLGLAGLGLSAATVLGSALWFASRGLGPAEAAKADVVIVLSAGVDRGAGELDAFSIARVEAGVALWRKGVAPRLLMSGGPDKYGLHVAEALKQAAIRLGAPERAILVEGNSVSTFENARFTLEVARAEGFRRAVIVSDDYHLLRAWSLFRFWRAEGDVEIVALAPADGRARAGFGAAALMLGRETLALPYNGAKMIGQLGLGLIGRGADRMIR